MHESEFPSVRTNKYVSGRKENKQRRLLSGVSEFTSSFDFHALVHDHLMQSPQVPVQSGPHAAGTRGGRRRLQTVGRCARPSCSSRVNLRGETHTGRVFRAGAEFLDPSIHYLTGFVPQQCHRGQCRSMAGHTHPSLSI